MLDGLEARGFKTNQGEDDSGVHMLCVRRAGGFYFGASVPGECVQYDNLMVHADVGASQMIVDGGIKIKNDSSIKRFTPNGIEFENGSSLPADVIILATGCAFHLHFYLGFLIACLLIDVYKFRKRQNSRKVAR